MTLTDPPQPVTHLAHLVGIQGIATGSRFGVNSPQTTIGSDGFSDIVLADSTVSPHHATIRRLENGGIEISSEDDVNCVFVNNQSIRQVRLQAADIVRIGDNEFRLEA